MPAVGNQVHEYYQLPFTIPATVFVGKALHRYVQGWRFHASHPKMSGVALLLALCLVALPVLSFLRVSNFMKGEKRQSALFLLASAVQEHSSAQDLVVTVSDGDPVYLYLSHRKGWHGFVNNLSVEFLKQKADLGARYLVGEKETFERNDQERNLAFLLSYYKGVVETDAYFVLDIHSPRPLGPKN